MRKFKKGDRVIVGNPPNIEKGSHASGQCGTVVGYAEDLQPRDLARNWAGALAVEFADGTVLGSHDCCGLVPSNRGQWVGEEYLRHDKRITLKKFYEAVHKG